MGTLYSDLDWTGNMFDGCTLGDPAIPEGGVGFVWDHPTLPDGTIDVHGNVFVLEET